MAHYTKEQLWGSGSLNETLTGTKQFDFVNNSSGSTYFTFEITRNSQGFYDSGSLVISASFSSETNVTGLVTSSYIQSIILGQGSSSFVYTPSGSIAANVGRFRGTGELYLDVT